MKSKMKLMPLAVGLAFCATAPAYAATGVMFDRDGANYDAGLAGAGAAQTLDRVATLITGLRWNPGNTLIVNTTGDNPLTGAIESDAPLRDGTVLMQARLSALLNPADGDTGVVAGTEFTFQMSVRADHSIDPASGAHVWSDIGDRDDGSLPGSTALDGIRDGDQQTGGTGFGGGDLLGFFRLYYSNRGGLGANPLLLSAADDVSNAVPKATGLGFGDNLNSGTPNTNGAGTLDDEYKILEGFVRISNLDTGGRVCVSGSTQDGTIVGGTALLDRNAGNGDQQNAVRTVCYSGNGNFNIDVTFQDTQFFKSDIKSLVVGGDIDLNNTGNNDPLKGVDPTDRVVGVLTDDPSLGAIPRKALNELTYGNDTVGTSLVNNFSCGTAVLGKRCSFHSENSAATNIFGNAIPEPGSVALLGLGLGALGFGVRRRRKV